MFEVRVSAGLVPFADSDGASGSRFSSQLLLAVLGLWTCHFRLGLCHPTAFLSASQISLCVSPTGTCVTGWRVCPPSRMVSSQDPQLERPRFQIESHAHAQVPGLRTWTYLFLVVVGLQFNPLQLL